MPETVRKKVVESGTTKAALETAKLFVQPAAHTAIAASDVLLTGGLAIPAEWAMKKLVRKMRGVHEVEFYDRKYGKMKLTGEFVTLPNGLRRLKKIDSIVVTKPSPYYTQEKKRLEMMEKTRRRYAR